MTPENFSYWLKGFFEMREPDIDGSFPPMTERQLKIMQDHLDLVFTKVTPEREAEEKKEKTLLEKFMEENKKRQQGIPGGLGLPDYNPSNLPGNTPWFGSGYSLDPNKLYCMTAQGLQEISGAAVGAMGMGVQKLTGD